MDADDAASTHSGASSARSKWLRALEHPVICLTALSQKAHKCKMCGHESNERNPMLPDDADADEDERDGGLWPWQRHKVVTHNSELYRVAHRNLCWLCPKVFLLTPLQTKHETIDKYLDWLKTQALSAHKPYIKALNVYIQKFIDGEDLTTTRGRRTQSAQFAQVMLVQIDEVGQAQKDIWTFVEEKNFKQYADNPELKDRLGHKDEWKLKQYPEKQAGYWVKGDFYSHKIGHHLFDFFSVSKDQLQVVKDDGKDIVQAGQVAEKYNILTQKRVDEEKRVASKACTFTEEDLLAKAGIPAKKPTDVPGTPRAITDDEEESESDDDGFVCDGNVGLSPLIPTAPTPKAKAKASPAASAAKGPRGITDPVRVPSGSGGGGGGGPAHGGGGGGSGGGGGGGGCGPPRRPTETLENKAKAIKYRDDVLEELEKIRRDFAPLPFCLGALHEEGSWRGLSVTFGAKCTSTSKKCAQLKVALVKQKSRLDKSVLSSYEVLSTLAAQVKGHIEAAESCIAACKALASIKKSAPSGITVAIYDVARKGIAMSKSMATMYWEARFLEDVQNEKTDDFSQRFVLKSALNKDFCRWFAVACGRPIGEGGEFSNDFFEEAKVQLMPIAVAIIEDLVTDWLSQVKDKDIENPSHSDQFQSMSILLEELLKTVGDESCLLSSLTFDLRLLSCFAKWDRVEISIIKDACASAKAKWEEGCDLSPLMTWMKDSATGKSLVGFADKRLEKEKTQLATNEAEKARKVKIEEMKKALFDHTRWRGPAGENAFREKAEALNQADAALKAAMRQAARDEKGKMPRKRAKTIEVDSPSPLHRHWYDLVREKMVIVIHDGQDQLMQWVTKMGASFDDADLQALRERLEQVEGLLVNEDNDLVKGAQGPEDIKKKLDAKKREVLAELWGLISMTEAFVEMFHAVALALRKDSDAPAVAGSTHHQFAALVPDTVWEALSPLTKENLRQFTNDKEPAAGTLKDALSRVEGLTVDLTPYLEAESAVSQRAERVASEENGRQLSNLVTGLLGCFDPHTETWTSKTPFIPAELKAAVVKVGGVYESLATVVEELQACHESVTKKKLSTPFTQSAEREMKKKIQKLITAWEEVAQDIRGNECGESKLHAGGVSLPEVQKVGGIMDTISKAHKQSTFSQQLRYLQHEVDAGLKCTKKVPDPVDEEQEFRNWVKTYGRRCSELRANISKQDEPFQRHIDERGAELTHEEQRAANACLDKAQEAKQALRTCLFINCLLATMRNPDLVEGNDLLDDLRKLYASRDSQEPGKPIYTSLPPTLSEEIRTMLGVDLGAADGRAADGRAEAEAEEAAEAAGAAADARRKGRGKGRAGGRGAAAAAAGRGAAAAAAGRGAAAAAAGRGGGRGGRGRKGRGAKDAPPSAPADAPPSAPDDAPSSAPDDAPPSDTAHRGSKRPAGPRAVFARGALRARTATDVDPDVD